MRNNYALISIIFSWQLHRKTYTSLLSKLHLVAMAVLRDNVLSKNDIGGDLKTLYTYFCNGLFTY